MRQVNKEVRNNNDRKEPKNDRKHWKPFMTLKECSEYISVSESTIRRYVNARAIPFNCLPLTRHGGGKRHQIRFDLTAIDLWMRKNAVEDADSAYVELKEVA